ncbi:Flocculation suppression protein [Neophaeococcomyces mojaviensis]|uniref:Flocculation suppression protein n=1 Tax=Neophaeococcomyces mojaviensis TaxID=3383035 RepID=A0ACC3AL73_9EURO|nr:Flocculation suppression protein [Knufia sp. JES_112]
MHTALPPDSSLRGDLTNVQKEVDRQQESLKQSEQSEYVGVNGGNRQSYYSNSMALDPPVSPRGYAFSESRRSSIQMEPPPFGSRPPVPPIPPQFSSSSSSSSHRYGSISATQTSPSFSKPPLPGPPQPHPLSNVVAPPPNLARRHTSADIREHGWPIPPNANGSPYASGVNSVQWQPSSPTQPPEGDQQLQNQLASYQINGSRRTTITAADQESIPPMQTDVPPSGLGVGNVSWGVGVSKFPRPNFELHSAPATRRSSMATLHSLLNPADTAEQENEDEGMNDDRKRKRLA